MAKKLISYDDDATGLGLPDVVEEGLNATYAQIGDIPEGVVKSINGIVPGPDGSIDIETGDPNAVTSTDFAQFRLSTDPNEVAPPGVVLFYLPPPTEVFTDFSSGEVGSTPQGWTPQFSTETAWTIVADPSATEGKAVQCANPASRMGLSWDIASIILAGDTDGELVWKWRTNLATIPARAFMLGTGDSGAESGYHGAVRNQSLATMGKYVAGEHLIQIGTQVEMDELLDLDWHITRFRKQGSDLMARTWKANQTEPDSWQVTAEDTSFTDPGWWGLLSHATAAATHTYDWVGFAAGDRTAPKGA